VKIGVFIPTWNAAKHLPHCLPPLLQSPLKPKILIIDSSSKDNTVAIAQSFGIQTEIIPQKEFNHGLTRERGRKLLNADIIVMMTSDAYATSPEALEKLIEPIVQGKASAAYGRQLPHHGASLLEAFPRTFNYPEQSHFRTLKDLPSYGVYTFFCSDSFAAYSNRALDSVGGFPRVLLGEDSAVVAKLLRQGDTIAYVAEATVRHSHHYTLRQEFQRYVDTGLARQEFADLLEGSDSRRGSAFTKQLMKEVIDNEPLMLPYALAQTLCKASGYHLGRIAYHGPRWLKRLLCSQPEYY